jgi:hypothetical protein
LLLLCLVLPGAFGGARGEEAVEEPLNQEWILCVSALDVSALPESRRVLGSIIAADLTASLSSLDRRIRVSPEYAYYQEAAWAKNLNGAAKKIAAKREERDQLLYKGDPDWKYRRDLRTIDQALLTLEEDYRKAESSRPQVFPEPAFKLTEENGRGLFPDPPPEGGEYRFCLDRKIDAFLAGRVSEYHGRIYVVLRLYTLYTRSYHAEEGLIFSPENMGGAMEELTGRLTAVVAGTSPGALRVHVEPEDATVLINGSFASRGDLPPLERSPGKIELTILADNYAPAVLPLEIASGEMAELFINLSPLAFNSFTITLTPETSGASIYRGALYAGETPLSLMLPLNRHEYVQGETSSGETGSLIVPGGGAVREERALNLAVQPPREAGTVNKYRRWFYGAWGRFWLFLPAAMLMRGIADTEINAYNYRGNPDLYDSANTKYYLSTGFTIAAGLSAVETLIHLFRYISITNKNATTLVSEEGEE